MNQIRSILLKLEGGLGNQFYQYATALSFSLRYQIPLKIIERSDSPDDFRRHSHLGLFSCSYSSVSSSEKIIYRLLFVKHLGIGKFLRRNLPKIYAFKFISDPEDGFYPDLLEGKSGILFLRGYWQSFKYFESLQDRLRKDFTLSFPPIDSENKKILDKIENSNAVALHIRRGDYHQIPFFRENFGLCSLDYYQLSIEELVQKVSDPAFYVFSDDPEWAKQNLKLKYPAHFVSHNVGKCDYEDFRLMRTCKHFIIANSSFSWWAAWLGDFPGKIVFAPDPWFKNDPMPKTDRIPSEWVSIKS